MKKLVSLLLSLIMLISLAPLAVAEEDVLTICFTDGWTGGPEALVPTDSPFMQEWMKQTGIQVKSVTLTNEQLAISPEKPDICMVYDTSSWLGSNVFEMISYGELISLNDLIDKGLCPNYMAALESTGDGLQCVSNDEGVIPGFFMLRAKDSPLAMLHFKAWDGKLTDDFVASIPDEKFVELFKIV